jgi:hypothetical protein
MTMTEANSPTSDEARIDQAAEAIRGMSHDLVDELPLRPWVTDTLRNLTLQAPLKALAIAFLLGVFVARRRS